MVMEGELMGESLSIVAFIKVVQSVEYSNFIKGLTCLHDINKSEYPLTSQRGYVLCRLSSFPRCSLSHLFSLD